MSIDEEKLFAIIGRLVVERQLLMETIERMKLEERKPGNPPASPGSSITRFTTTEPSQ